MYKVLIADDENIICRGLAGMISQYPGLQVVATASDGEIALEKAKETHPDLMLVDINMPFLNGLEFIEAIKNVLPEAVIIVITGYDDFAYVQKALRLGVTDYMLKPVMEHSLFEVLEKAVKKMDGMHSSKGYVDWMEEQLGQNHSQMVSDFFRSWIRDRMGEDEVKRQMGYLKIQIPASYWITAIHIYRDYEKEAPQGYSESTDDLPYLECSDIVQKCFAPYSDVVCFQMEEGALAVISEILSGEQWEQLQRELSLAIDEKLHAKMELVQQQGDSLMECPAVIERVLETYKERMHYSEVVLQTISIINTQWGNSELSLQVVADSLYVSGSYLSRIFHRETGENFASFLTRKRINEAKTLLKNTNLKMYEIAQKTGYTSQHYFSNTFKKITGISPADYRKNILE